MAKRQSDAASYLLVEEHQRLSAVPLEFEGREVICYFVEDVAAPPLPDSQTNDDQAIVDALAVIGAWDDLDWEATADALDRIRRESAPTPPIVL